MNVSGKPVNVRNSSTRLFVLMQGILAGFTGAVHGVAEASQGYIPTEGLMLSTFGAFSIIPNYLVTGLAAIIVALSVMMWNIGYVHRKSGPTVFLLLSILLFLVGGGIAQVLFFLITWRVATRINKPLTWGKNALSEKAGKQLAKSWGFLFFTGYFFLLVGIGIWLFLTPPGNMYREIGTVDYICWSSLVSGLIFQILTIISGFARDIVRQNQGV